MSTFTIHVPAHIIDLPFHHTPQARKYLRAAYLVEYLRAERKRLVDVPESVQLQAVVDSVDFASLQAVLHNNPPAELSGFKLITEEPAKPVSSMTITQEEKSTVVEIEAAVPTRTIFPPQEKPLDIRTKPIVPDDTCVPGRVTVIIPQSPSTANRYTEINNYLNREKLAIFTRGHTHKDWTAVVTPSDYGYLTAYFGGFIPRLHGFTIVEGKEPRKSYPPAGVKAAVLSPPEVDFRNVCKGLGDSRVPHRSEGRSLEADKKGFVSIVVPAYPEGHSVLTQAGYIREYLKVRGNALKMVGLEHSKCEAWLTPEDFAAAKKEWVGNPNGLFLSNFKLRSLDEEVSIPKPQDLGEVTKEVLAASKPVDLRSESSKTPSIFSQVHVDAIVAERTKAENQYNSIVLTLPPYAYSDHITRSDYIVRHADKFYHKVHRQAGYDTARMKIVIGKRDYDRLAQLISPTPVLATEDIYIHGIKIEPLREPSNIAQHLEPVNQCSRSPKEEKINVEQAIDYILSGFSTAHYTNHFVRELHSLPSIGARKVVINEVEDILKREKLAERILPIITLMNQDRIPDRDRRISVSPDEFVTAQKFGEHVSSRTAKFLGVLLYKPRQGKAA